LFEQVLQRSQLLHERLEALVALTHMVGETGNREPLRIAASFIKESGTLGISASIALMQMYASVGELVQARQMAEQLCSQYPGTEIQRRVLTFLASFSAFSATQQGVSRQALAVLKSKYRNELDAGLLAALESANPRESSLLIQTIANADHHPLLSNYPNPFNPTTVIQFQVQSFGLVSLKVYDLLGREIAVLVREQKEPGVYSVRWDAGHLPSGMYFYRLESANKFYIQKMLLVR
jgi:hypothetical protein